MKAIKTGTIETSKKNREWYERKGYKMTGETLTLAFDYTSDLKTETSYIVFSGTWTRYQTVRDCGNHYIYAGYSSYYRIDKNSLEITADVEDE